MKNKKLVLPPMFFEYEGEVVEDKGWFFQKKDGQKIPIVTVWENGAPVTKEVEVSEKAIRGISEDKELVEEQIQKIELWKKLKKIYGDARAKTEKK
jgi:hypothetical protein